MDLFKNMEEGTLPKLLPFYQTHEEEEGKSSKWQRSNLHLLRSENVESMLPKRLE